MSKSKEKLKKIDQEIAEKKQKDLAKAQLEAAQDIAMKGFSRYGVRDFFENKVVQTVLLSVLIFFGLFFGFGLFFYFTRNFQIMNILGSLFIGELISGIPNFIWWIAGIAGAVVIIIVVIKQKKVKE